MQGAYKKAIESYGVTAQKIKALEEMGELIAEVARDLLGKGNLEKIMEETADVENMTEQLCIIFDARDRVEQIKTDKMRKVLENIGGGMTILEDFCKKYPEAELTTDGTPDFCPHVLGYERNENCKEGSVDCDACWKRPVAVADEPKRMFWRADEESDQKYEG